MISTVPVTAAPAQPAASGRVPTLEEIQRQRQLAEALMREGGSAAPVQHWTQAAARLAQALVGGLNQDAARKGQGAMNEDATSALMGLYGSYSGAQPGSGSVATTQPQMPQSQAAASAQPPVPAQGPLPGPEGTSPRTNMAAGIAQDMLAAMQQQQPQQQAAMAPSAPTPVRPSKRWTWTARDATWNSLGGPERAAAMALMEAGNIDDAKNALGAMYNRASQEGVDIGQHVSEPIYQPTIEPSQWRRLGRILNSPEHKKLVEWYGNRSQGLEQDPVNGATHFLAPERQMLSLEAGNPRKYRSWRQWTGFDPNTNSYNGVIMRDGSHAFLAPDGNKRMALGGQQPQAPAQAPAQVADSSGQFLDQDTLRRLLSNPQTAEVGQKLIMQQMQQRQPLGPMDQARMKLIEAQTAAAQAKPAQQSVGQQALDRKFAATYSEDIASGAIADAMAQLGTLKSIASKLETGDNVSGPVLGMVPESVRAFTNPQSVDIQNQIANIVQRSLRPILGAQFTEKEGENLIRRAYNPQLGEAENARRLSKLAGVAEKMAQQKLAAAKYFEQNGTLNGFQGSANFSIADVENAVDAIDTAPGRAAQPQGVPPQAVQELQANPTPEMMRYFDETFGPGAAERALNGR